ncbi:MAG: NAD(P)-dependent oxidoreductase [Rhizobiaceae bacterium]|nr:NAD(P)-dependent oxidoreductase [Rhizobiaceae bacterium]
MRIAFIGFGEAGRAFAASLRNRNLSISAYDVQFGGPDDAAFRVAAHERNVKLADSAEAAVADADWVFSAVTAADSLEAARSVSEVLKPGQVYFDINSVSAGRKKETAALLGPSGATYVDVAVMAPVDSRGHQTPLLVAGPVEGEIAAGLSRLGFGFELVGKEIGGATAIKMVRSLFVKGLEAITVQALLAADAAGCFDNVYASLSGSYPKLGWPEFPTYNFERVTRHGLRRAAEMRECAASMKELGFPAGFALADAIADLQQEIGSLGIRLDPGDDLTDALATVGRMRAAASSS